VGTRIRDYPSDTLATEVSMVLVLWLKYHLLSQIGLVSSHYGFLLVLLRKEGG